MNSTLRQKGLSVNLQRRFWTKTLGIPKKANWEHLTCIFGLTGCFHGILPPKNWFLALVIIFMNFHWPLSLRWKNDISNYTRCTLCQWLGIIYPAFIMGVQLYNKFISLFCISRVCIWWINAQSTLSPCGEFQILKLMLNCYWRWICQDLKCRKLSTWRKKTFLSHQMNNLNPRLHELTTKLVSIFIQNGLLVLLPSEWNIHDPSPEFVSSCDKSLTRAICCNLTSRQKHWGQLELPRNSKSPCLPKLYPKVAS